MKPRTTPLRRQRPAKKHLTIDKSVLPFGVRTRMEDKAYQRSAADRTCMACDLAGRPSVPGGVVLAHINLIENGAGKGRKADDSDSVWLCGDHHRDMDTCEDRCRWLVINILLPMRRRAYEEWKESDLG